MLTFLGAIAVYLIGATAAFNHALVLPLSEPFIAGFAAMAAMVGYRFMITDKDRRLLQKSFALYLAPDVIDRMLASNKLPVLGGETRHVTMFFSDLEGFSLIAETMSPEALMALMNEYLSEMTDIIEGHGGYVDKYIGDSIVAVFGAPADDDDHAGNALRAALDCCTRLEELNRSAAAFGGSKVAQRIGINSGDALVGNFGSRRRFNYSVMSDAVNLASRLEGANKFYGTTVIASETTVALIRRDIRLARARHHPRQGAQQSAEDLSVAGAGGGVDARAGRGRRLFTPRDSRTGAPASSRSPKNVSSRPPKPTGHPGCSWSGRGSMRSKRHQANGTRSGPCRKSERDRSERPPQQASLCRKVRPLVSTSPVKVV